MQTSGNRAIDLFMPFSPAISQFPAKTFLVMAPRSPRDHGSRAAPERHRTAVQRGEVPRRVAATERLLRPGELDQAGRGAGVADAVGGVPDRLLGASLAHGADLRQ